MMAYFEWAWRVDIVAPVAALERTTCPDMEVVMSHLLRRTATERMAEVWRWVWVRRRAPLRV